jgi:hypothetical protein
MQINTLHETWRKEPPEFVVEQERLDRRDDNVRLAPIVALFLIDDAREIVFEQCLERLIGLHL